jgi:hypothetical protein
MNARDIGFIVFMVGVGLVMCADSMAASDAGLIMLGIGLGTIVRG